MTTDQLFRLLILVSLAVSMTISGYFRHQANKRGGQLDPGGNRVLLLLRMAALIVLSPLIGFLVNTEWFVWARYHSPEWLRWCGFVLTTMSIPGLYWLFSTIGTNISPTHSTRDNHQLITDGPYRYVRHPLYTIGFATFFGIGLMANMWWLLLGLILLSIVITWRTNAEEENLVKEFGEPYRIYCERTGRYFPKLFR